MTTICAIEHIHCETLGLIAEVLKKENIAAKRIRPFKKERIPPRLDSHAGLIVMGRPMGVYEQQTYPLLRQEIRLIERTLSEGKPILGICLGSQLLATALGAVVTPGLRKEIGWHPVTLFRVAGTDPLWRGLGSSFVGFHWHGDVFALPRGSVSLAWSTLTDCQAFRHGQSAVGILFHMEVTRSIVSRMTRTFRNELEESGVNATEILSRAPQHLPQLHDIGKTVFGRWAQLVKGQEPRAAAMPRLLTKRVYDAPAAEDGVRFLVDRLWPRGAKKGELKADGWLKEVAPSSELRKWFGHDPEKWPEFRRRYFAELNQRPEAWQPILEAARRGPVSLLFSTRDIARNNAVALREFLETKREDLRAPLRRRI